MNTKLPFKINWRELIDPILIGFLAFGISALTKQMNGAELVSVMDEHIFSPLEGTPEFYDITTTTILKEENNNV